MFFEPYIFYPNIIITKKNKIGISRCFEFDFNINSFSNKKYSILLEQTTKCSIF